MKALVANIEDVFREAAARWTLVAYFVLSTLFILIFAASVNLDIVNGALAGAKLFGKPVEMRNNSSISIDQVVQGFESGFSSFLFVLSTFLAIFSTAHLVPRMQERGTVDLYLSRPVGRVQLLLARYFAGLLLAASNVFYLVGSVWLIVIWKTHIVHPRFLLGSVIILFAIATLLALAFLIGVVTSSTAVSIMVAYATFFMSSFLALHEKMEAAVSSNLTALFIKSMYWFFPKTFELGKATFQVVSGADLAAGFTPAVISTAIFGLGALALATFAFTRKEF